MGDVVELADRRAPVCEPVGDVAHFSGPAKCLACGFTWIAVAQVGTVALECPHCSCDRGRTTGPCWPEGNEHWICNCGCDVFVLRRSGALCIGCGVTPVDWVG